ncbi:MAG: hypothetical protein EZS28_051116, partial [Streblomastix strix]
MKTKLKVVQSQKTPFHSYDLNRILKQTQTQTQITQVHFTLHLTNLLHHTLNNTHYNIHWKKTLAILRIISPGDPRGYKEKEPEPKQPKLQQYTGLMDVIEKFHEIMKPIVEEEKEKPKAMFHGQYKHYSNKGGPLFFYPPKNYRPTPIPRPKDLILSEEQWKQFDGDIREGVVPYSVIDLITFAAEQIELSETQSEDQEQLSNDIERIVADGSDDNEDNDQSEHVIEPKHVTNGNDGLRKNDSGTQLQATVNGEAN